MMQLLGYRLLASVGWVFVCAVIWTTNTSVAEANRVQDEDMNYLPPYCWARMRPSNEAEINKWKGIIGPDFQHVHHFCTAQAFIRRSFDPRKRAKDKKQDLSVAKTNLEYIFDHLESPDYVLLPEINMTMGKVLDRMGDPVNAARYYHRALKMKPDFTLGVAALSDFYVRQGNVEAARKILEEGVKNRPDSIILKRRISRLDTRLEN